jgi:hypothetical protein
MLPYDFYCLEYLDKILARKEVANRDHAIAVCKEVWGKLNVLLLAKFENLHQKDVKRYE